MEKKVNHKKQKNNRSILIAVAVVVVVLSTIFYIKSLNYITTDDAQLESDISPVSPRISGYIGKVCFTDNQLIKRGDTLVVLDDRDLKIKEDQAEAALENAEANLGTIKENAQSARENGGIAVYKIDEIKIRLSNAKEELERNTKMMEGHSVTQQQFDKVKTDEQVLEQQLNSILQQQKESNSKTIAAEKQVDVALSTVKQRQIDLNFAKLQHSYAFVTAPFDGIVSKRNAVPGQLLQAGQPLCSIVYSQKIWVVANFKETQMSNIKVGMKAEVEADAFSSKVVMGRVESFSSATGAKFTLIPPDNATGNFVKVVQRIPVKITLDTSSVIYKALKPGMSVYVKVIRKS